MADRPVSALLRPMTLADVAAVVAVQEPGAVAGLGAIFPQDTHPFPRETIASRWREEISAPEIDCLLVLRAAEVAGFAATRGDELLHFGIAVEHWGTGLAQAAHDAVLDRMRSSGTTRAWLRVFEQNRRGRRFYERLGWHEAGAREHSSFPPHPVLVRYERGLGDRTSDR